MEERLKQLKKSMKSTAFDELEFTDKHREVIKQNLRKHNQTEGDLFVNLMQLLVKEKTGHELTTQLRSRGIEKFEDNEGYLYTLLHRLEHKGLLQSSWSETQVKRYMLNQKGKKLLAKLERSKSSNAALKLLLEVRLL